MWCRGKAICPALATQALQVAQEDFKDFANIKPDEVVESVSIEKIVEVYKQLPLLKQFIKAIEGRVFGDLSAGIPVPGLKLVNGRRSKSWNDDNETILFLDKNGIDPYEQKLLSPAKAIKALDKTGKKEVEKLYTVNDGKPVVVSNTDKRKAITTAADDFAEFNTTKLK